MNKNNTDFEDLLDNLYSDDPIDDEIKNAQNNLQLKMEEVYPQKIYYCLIPNTSLGNIWVATTDRGLIAVDFNLSEDEFVSWLANKIKARFIEDKEKLIIYRDQIRKYLSGELLELNLAIDFSILSPFQKVVLQAAKAIPRGQVSSYGAIAKIVGKPKAFQAVGQALRHNPIPIALPCHRVIASDGSLGGYAGEMNSERKRKLLQLEGAMLF